MKSYLFLGNYRKAEEVMSRVNSVFKSYFEKVVPKIASAAETNHVFARALFEMGKTDEALAQIQL